MEAPRSRPGFGWWFLTIGLAVVLVGALAYVGHYVGARGPHAVPIAAPALAPTPTQPGVSWAYFDAAVDAGTTASVVYDNGQSGVETRVLTDEWHTAESFTRNPIGRLAFSVISDGPGGVDCTLRVDGYAPVTAHASGSGAIAVCGRDFQ